MPTIARRIRSRRSASSVGGDRLLERLERGLVVAARPRRRRRARAARSAAVAPFGRAEPRAGGQALGEEVALQRLEQLRAPPRSRRGRAACVPSFARRLGVARVELERLAQRGLVAGRGELVGRGGDERVEEGLDLRRRDRAGELGDHLRRRETPSPPGSPGRRSWRRAPGSRRRRPSPARPCRRAWRSRPRAPGRAGGTGRTTRPRSRRPRAPRASARPPRPMKSASLTSLIIASSRLASGQNPPEP